MMNKHTKNYWHGKEQWLHNKQFIRLWILFKTLQIATDLRKQIELENPDLKQQINFIGRLDRNKGGTMFFIIEWYEETTLNFHKMLQQLFDFDHA